jgi:integrase
MKGNASPVSEEHVPDLDELKQILHYCDIRTKATIMVALSSGMRISEVIHLLPDDIYFNETPTRVNVRAEISKNSKRRTTFISPEATEILREWLRIKDDYIEKSMASFNFKYMQNLKNKEKTEIFPFSANRIRESFNRACEKAGFTGKTKINGDFDHIYKRGRRNLHYHNLRKFFRTYFGNADLAEHLMGHTGYLSNYRQFNDKQLAQEYMKHVENVTVFEKTPDLTDVNKEMNNLKQENKALKQEMDRIRMELLEVKLKQVQELQRKELK